MRENKNPPKGGDYEVGYGKPPKHSQFLPGQSGFKGRRRKKSENLGKLIARVRDETLSIGGETMTRMEVVVRQVFNQTLKSGKPRDLGILFDLLDKHGALPEFDQRAEAEAGAQRAMEKIFSYFHRVNDIDPADAEGNDRDNDEEALLVIECPHCGPSLRERWKKPDYLSRAERYARSRLHEQVLKAREGQSRPANP